MQRVFSPLRRDFSTLDCPQLRNWLDRAPVELRSSGGVGKDRRDGRAREWRGRAAIANAGKKPSSAVIGL
jgi:hypothetical protein